jgi:membrane protein DedA with SNARE-associated domain
MIDLIIAVVVINICVAVVTGTIVYYLVGKKYSNELDRLKGRVAEDERLFNKLYDEYRKHYYEKH